MLPAMIRKIHLAKCLMKSDWRGIEKDLNKRPVGDVTGDSKREEIEAMLKRHGVSVNEVKLWGTGKPLREFLWSEEMADACVFVMEQVDFDDLKGTDKEVRNCHINIGTGKEISIRDLAMLIKEVVKYSGVISFDSSKPDGTMRKLTDVSKLNALGWRHEVEVEEGVERMYRWYLK